MGEHIQVGTPLYGFCGGYFGRDCYEPGRVEALGPDWVVTRDPNGKVHTATDLDPQVDLVEYTVPDDESRWWDWPVLIVCSGVVVFPIYLCLRWA